MIVTSA